MANRRNGGDRFYVLNDRRLRVLKLTPDSHAAVREKYRCEGHNCSHLSSRWHTQPEAVDVTVERLTSAWVESLSGLALVALDAELVDALAPYCHNILFGRVLVDQPSGRPEPSRLITVSAPAQCRLRSDRGRYCRHKRYACCGVCVNTVGWAKGAIVERTLDDRLVYVDQDGSVLVADELVEKLDLRRRFPKLWLERIDVVAEPLDKETLPGDPGWDGEIRRTYLAWLDVLVSIPYTPARNQGERAIYANFHQRLNDELAAIGAELALKDGGSHGSCRYCARGFDTESLRDAVMRAVNTCRVPVEFAISIEALDHRGPKGPEQLRVWGDPSSLPSWWPGKSAILSEGQYRAEMQRNSAANDQG